MRIDSHLHLWHFAPDEFEWIPDSMAALRRDFLPQELKALCADAAVEGVIAVQARQSVEETRWLLELASTTPLLGVVGWAPIAAADFPATLERLQQEPLLKGLRHIVQAKPGILAQPEFQRGMRCLQGTGLVYDLLLYSDHLSLALPFVDLFPQQIFVLDHLGKPAIARREIETWSKHLHELAKRPNVCCKASGLVTEADLTDWTPMQLRPYLDIALECFGPDRLMVGTDWPVCTAGCSYAQWWALIEDWIAPLSAAERAAILGESATRIYRLQRSTDQYHSTVPGSPA
jgi:L-fuconolactonase